MDARISTAQATQIYNSERAAKLNIYTPIPGNGNYHYSWHPANTICVGIGKGAGNHRNFTCNISGQVVVTLVAAGGTLAVGGAGGINAVALANSVSNCLYQRFRALISDPAFNNIGRSPQSITFNNTRVANRYDTRHLIINNVRIQNGNDRPFAGGLMNGFVVTQNYPGLDTYYRNYDVREVALSVNGERLRFLHRDQDDEVRIDGTSSGIINCVRLL